LENQSALIIHLGMSGRLCILTKLTPPTPHDHIDIRFAQKKWLRFTDPRRFGAFLWSERDVFSHPLLKNLGVEPLEQVFTGDYLWQSTRKRRVCVKSFIMDSKVVTGVGNIYATEALFTAGIHPQIPVQQLTLKQCHQLVIAIKNTLHQAIKQGGTTLKDFLDSAGKPGYFVNQLQAYGRAGLPCKQCHAPLKLKRLAQRSTVFCQVCQKK
jgi:formamidopyrimidine-DNA glycosylase